jgi:hypothetical protein
MSKEMPLIALLALSGACYAAAQTPPPAPPACLAGPVTRGAVTLSCSLIDNTGSFGADPGLFSGGVQYVLQVRITSSDPDVVGVRVGVTANVDTGIVAAPTTAVTEWRSLSKTCSTQPPTIAGCGDGGVYVYRYSLALASTAISAIQVDETKTSSSQVF